jgi:predicted esterase
MKTAAAFACFAALLRAQQPPNPYPLGPDSQPQPGAPKGEVTRLTLPPGKFYPGTPHDYAIYVPAQYDASKPTPYMIFMDGLGQLGNGTRTNAVFDNLIARHEMPPVIGIFVNPGVLPAVKPANPAPDAVAPLGRYERVFEYDSLSDRFSRFLLEELVPAVAVKYNLSKSADDHAVAGVSTGAVAAFAAAWNRPDQFHRVVSFIGTFVAMKGADSLPGLIRKTEPKPIRIFMQDGKQDHIVPAEPFGTFYAGSWPISNEVMYQALQAAGYDVKYVLGEDGHSGRQGAAMMPDVLRWLWRDYPSPVDVKEPAHMLQPGWDPRGKVYSIVSAGKGWEPVGEHYASIEAIAPDRDGNTWFSAAGKTYRLGVDGKVAIATPKDVSLNVARTAKGAAYAVDATARRGLSYRSGAAVRALPLVDLTTPSSVALSPDQAMLIVTDSHSRYQWSFQLTADGSLENGEPFYRLEMPETGAVSGATSAIEDSIGQVYFATPLGIQVCEANGRVAAILNSPVAGETVTAIAWGGKDLDWIYAAAGGRLYRRAVKVKGTASWAALKLPIPPL